MGCSRCPSTLIPHGTRAAFAGLSRKIWTSTSWQYGRHLEVCSGTILCRKSLNMFHKSMLFTICIDINHAESYLILKNMNNYTIIACIYIYIFCIVPRIFTYIYIYVFTDAAMIALIPSDKEGSKVGDGWCNTDWFVWVSHGFDGADLCRVPNSDIQYIYTYLYTRSNRDGLNQPLPMSTGLPWPPNGAWINRTAYGLLLQSTPLRRRQLMAF